MTRTKGSHGETTRARIREAAARLMSEGGFDGVTMRALGADLGLRAGAIYRYFPDKESLAADLLSEALSGRAAALDNVHDEGDPSAALEQFCTAYLSWTLHSGAEAGMIRRALPGLGKTGQVLETASLSPEALLARILARGQEAGGFRVPDAQVTARVVLAVLETVAEDTRLAEDRRMRIGWSMVRRLVRA